jgi:hypothetical protein
MLVIRVDPERAAIIQAMAGTTLLPPNGAVRLGGWLINAALLGRRQSANERRGILVAMTDGDSHQPKRLAAEHSREMLRQEPIARKPQTIETSGSMT